MQRANAEKDNMGLTAFEVAKVRKKDVDIAKNYLNEDEVIDQLIKDVNILKSEKNNEMRGLRFNFLRCLLRRIAIRVCL